MGLSPVAIHARDLPDAWFQCVDAVLSHGRQWTVQQGSYVGQRRWELDYVTVHVTHPGVRPLVPEMPTHLAHVPPPTTMEYVEEYLPYLMTDQPLKKNEEYTYGLRLAGLPRVKSPVMFSRMHLPGRRGVPVGPAVQLPAGGGGAFWCQASQIETVIERFKTNHGTNQCSMSVAMPSDIHLDDPPCLREVDCRIIAPDGLQDGEAPALHFIVYFRSWDLWGGFPANLAALRLMQEYMAENIGVEAGEIIAASKGLHIYDHAWNVARLRTK